VHKGRRGKKDDARGSLKERWIPGARHFSSEHLSINTARRRLERRSLLQQNIIYKAKYSCIVLSISILNRLPYVLRTLLQDALAEKLTGAKWNPAATLHAVVQSDGLPLSSIIHVRCYMLFAAGNGKV
jgi:hypothetical protein